MTLSQLILPAFLAGLFTFLAPCTLPLLPAFLGFLSGGSAEEIQRGNSGLRRKLIWNTVSYVCGFSVVFIFLGSLFGLGGGVLYAYRSALARIGGVFLIFFGLFMLDVFKLPVLRVARAVRLPGFVHFLPGRPASSFVLGATFALAWTPCAGPILGSILTLAAAAATLKEGAFLLMVFSAGLALPFLLSALFLGSASRYVARFAPVLRAISYAGGALLIFLGFLLAAGNFSLWLALFNHFLHVPDWFTPFL